MDLPSCPTCYTPNILNRRWTAINDKSPLSHPLIRKNGVLERASWEEAMDLIVRKTKEIRDRLTSHGIGFCTSGQLFLEEYYVLALIGKAGLNTLHMDGNTRLCTATAAASMRESFGSDGQAGSYSDIDCTDCLFLVGHNVAATQTVLWSRMLDRLEGHSPPKLIVIDPRLSETAKEATVHLAPKIGTNMAVLNGIQHLMFKNKWIDQDYVSKHVVGLEALKAKVESYSPELVDKISGVPADKLREAARVIGTTPSLLCTALQGVYQSNQATASGCQVNNISLLRGLIGKAGSGVLQMNGQPTAQNNREAGCDGEYPGFRNFQNPSHMRELAELWNIEYERVPHWNEPTHVQNMLNYIAGGSIEMLWISGTNPLVSLPHLPRVRQLLSKPELFVICQDIYMTETADIADVVLPAAQWAEKTGCYTNVDRTVHLSQKAVDPPGKAKADLCIWLDFANRMNFRDKDGNSLITWTGPEEVFEGFKKMTKGRPCDYSGLTYELLTGGSGIQWPCNGTYPLGKERLYEHGQFFTDIEYCESFGHDLETGAPYTKEQYALWNPAGRAVLKAADYLPPIEQPTNEFPLMLSTGRRVHQFHTRTKTGRAPALQRACPSPQIEVSAEDAANAKISTGENVIVRSPRGAVEMPATISNISKGQTFIPFHFGYWDAPDDRARAANELTMERWDPVSKQPLFKAGVIRIEKCVTREDGTSLHGKEEHTTTKIKLQQRGVTAGEIINAAPREAHLGFWLCSAVESISQLDSAYTNLIPVLLHDLEIQTGLRILQRITRAIHDSLKVHCHKYHAPPENRHTRVPNGILDAVFGERIRSEADTNPYDALLVLQGLLMFLAYIDGFLKALSPAAQACWDEPFTKAINEAAEGISRQQAYIQQQIKVKAPQTLIAPSRVRREELL